MTSELVENMCFLTNRNEGNCHVYDYKKNGSGFCNIRNNQGRGKCNQPRLIALTEIIPDITTTEFNYCFIMHCFMENIQKLLWEMQVDFICAFKNTRTNAPGGRIARNHSSTRAL